MELLNQLIEVIGFAIEVSKTPIELAHLSNKARIVSQNMANGIEFRTSGSVQTGVTDEVGRQV